MTDDDVVLLLDRAAGLAPDRLEREPVAVVARRRGRRRRLSAGAGLGLAVVVLGAMVVPGALGGRQVLEPASQPIVATEFFDLLLPVNSPDGGRWMACLDLPGADMVSGPATLSPRATVSAVGTASERRAVQGCLERGAEVTPTARPDLRAVQVSVRTDDPGPLSVSVLGVYQERFSSSLVHDLTVENTSAEPVHVDDPGFGEVLPGGLFVGIDCSPTELDGSAVPGCFAAYSPFTLEPGQARTFQVRLASGTAGVEPLPLGEHAVELLLEHRTTSPFGGSDDAEGVTRVRLGYDVTGPSAPVDPSRAAFRPSGPLEFALLEGELGGDAATGCLWVAAPSGRRTPLLLVSNTAAADFSTRPFRVVDGTAVLAVEGQAVSLGGGFGVERDAPVVPGCPIEGTPFRGWFTQD
jgi:hypothetical protein